MNKKKKTAFRIVGLGLMIVYLTAFLFISMSSYHDKNAGYTFVLSRGTVLEKQDDCTVQFELSRDFQVERYLAFSTAGQSVSVYLDDELLYQFIVDDSQQYGSKEMNVIYIPKNATGKTLSIEFETVFNEMRSLPVFSVYPSYEMLIVNYLPHYVLDALIGVFGICMIVITVLLRKKIQNSEEYLGLGVFALLLAVWLYIGTDKYVILPFLDRKCISQLSYYVFILLLLPLQNYLSGFVTKVNPMITRLLKIACYLNVLAVTILELTHVAYLYQTLFTTHILMIFSILLALYGCMRNRGQLLEKGKYVLIGLSLVLLTAIGEIAAYYVWKDSYEIGKMFRYAFLVFLICYIMQLFSGYLKAEKRKMERIEYNKSLHNQLFMAQLKPHFLYNSLGAILHLVKQDQQKGYRALQNFTYYLRNNMELIELNTTIPMTKEMENIETYLKLEQLRFKDKLNYDIDLEEMNFYIPSYSVQMVVENAVKHGVTKNVDGGYIEIKSWRDENHYYIQVVDDGPGFDVLSYDQQDEQKHYGIRFAKMRIKAMSEGKMIIESRIGKGTKVTIVLPEDAKDKSQEKYIYEDDRS